MSFTWASSRTQFVSSPCTFQAVMEIIGLLGGAIWALYLSLLTFLVLVLSTRIDLRVLSLMLALGWAFIAAIAIAGPLHFMAGGLPISRFFGQLTLLLSSLRARKASRADPFSSPCPALAAPLFDIF